MLKTLYFLFFKVEKIWNTISTFLRSVYFNFAFLPFRQALKLPIWIERPAFHFRGYRGDIVIDADDLHFKMIRLGYRYNSWYPFNGINLQIVGKLVFHGRCTIGNSASVYVGNNGVIEFGDNVYIASKTRIICQKKIVFGKSTLIGWNSQIIDTDFHALLDIVSGRPTKILSPVIIGNKCWIASDCIVQKGTKLADNVIVSAGSVVSGIFKKENVILKGNPAMEIAEGYKLLEEYSL